MDAKVCLTSMFSRNPQKTKSIGRWFRVANRKVYAGCVQLPCPVSSAGSFPPFLTSARHERTIANQLYG
jgi:hypothetical protein